MLFRSVSPISLEVFALSFTTLFADRELEQQLDAEVKMAKEYRTKNPPGGKVNGTGHPAQSAADPLKGEVVRLYEDLTNVLVTKVSFNGTPYPAWPEFKEYTFNCTYTHVEGENDAGPNPSASHVIE